MARNLVHDLAGQRFGRLVAIAFTIEGATKHAKRQWKCECDCGKFTFAPTTALMQGARLSCGCLTKENIRRIDGGRRHKKGTAQRIAQTIYMSNAKKRGLSWELSFEDFVRITSSPCFYTGRLPSLKTTAPSGEIYLYNGIDRLDNSKGYSVENCVPCCTVVNEMKRTQTFEGFAALIAEIHNRINVLSEVELGMPLAQNI